jgi:hypothetical protein
LVLEKLPGFVVGAPFTISYSRKRKRKRSRRSMRRELST